MRVIDSAIKLRPFQKKFIKGAFRKGIDTAALSLPRGNGKSFLAGHLLARALTPGDPMHKSGAEYLLLAASLEQARITYQFIRSELEERAKEFRWLDSSTRVGITHLKSNTRLRVLSSKAKSAFGIVGCPLICCDEVGSWEVIGGQMMADAIFTAQGKPGSSLRVIFISTLAPSTAGWWHDLVRAGSQGSVYIQALKGDREKWDRWPEIRRVNPLTAISPKFREKLRSERNAARKDTRLKARFCSYRLNLPTADESTMLLTVSDFMDMAKRSVPPRVGKPLIGLDLGENRAWSAATAIFENGRIEARAVCPGVPSIADQERRDRQPSGTYQRLADAGVLVEATGLRVPPPKLLVDLIQTTWGRPAGIVCDFFRLEELRDTQVPCRVQPRRTQWSHSSFDIRSLRAGAVDGPFSVAVDSRSLLKESLRVALVENDSSGNFRLIKRTSNNESRDDVASAFALAAGAFARSPKKPTVGKRLHVVV